MVGDIPIASDVMTRVAHGVRTVLARVHAGGHPVRGGVAVSTGARAVGVVVDAAYRGTRAKAGTEEREHNNGE